MRLIALALIPAAYAIMSAVQCVGLARRVGECQRHHPLGHL
jgi:hypothetical protein